MAINTLILGSYPPPFGGISTHLQYFLPYMATQNYSVDLISPGKSWATEKMEGFTVHRMDTSKVKSINAVARRLPSAMLDFSRTRFVAFDFLKAQAICAVAEKAAARAELICAYHLLPWGLAGAFLAKKYNIPLMLVNFGEIYADPEFYRKHQKEVEYVVGTANHLVSVSRHCANSFANLGLEREVEVIPLGVDTTHFSPERNGSSIRSRYNINDNQQVVLFLGRMIRDMGLHTLLEAIPHYAEDAVTIIAGGSGELTGAAHNISKQYPDRVYVAENVPFDELPEYYAAADIIAAPSPDDRACMGLAMKEAMATGKPVVGCTVGGVPEAVIHDETGILVVPENPVALADALKNLLSNEAERHRMGTLGRKRALEVFDVDVTNSKMKIAYDSALNAR